MLEGLVAPLVDEAARLQFKQGFAQLKRLHHPNLALVEDFSFAPDGRPYLCMEEVEGQALAGPLSPARLLELLPPLARALGYLHRHGLVHGDVRPANLRLTADGTLKLLDVGGAIASGTAPRAPRGSAATMAPELARGDRVDGRTDLYALGATCCLLLTGEPPQAPEDPPGRPPRPLREQLPDLPPQLERAIQRLLAREPVGRPRSAAEALALFGLEAEPEDDARPLVASFAGRGEELALVEKELLALSQGKGPRLLAWVGAAGAGKTRLLDEVRAMVRLAGLPYMAAVCGVGRGRPFGPFLHMLEAAGPPARAAAEAAPPDQRAALARLLPGWGLAAEREPLEPREERVVAQAGMCRVLSAIAAEQGAVLALDDWDRADAASVETLAYLRRNARGVPLLIVTTGREQGYMGAAARALPPLRPAEVAALVGSMLGEGAPPPDFLAALSRWTGGHAGQVQRITAHLLQAGGLVREDGRWSAPRGLAAGELPPELLAVSQAPLAALTGPATELAEAAAVLGPDARLTTLAAMAALEEDLLFAALAELQARQILTLEDGRACFASGGLQQAAYERASEGRRLWLHALAAMHLEREPDADTAIALAGHLIASRQAQPAMAAVLQAAELAMARFEVERARALLVDALALARDWPGDHARWRRDALVQLTAIERWRGDFDAMATCLDEAQPLAERLAEPLPLLRLWVLRAAHHNQRMTPQELRQAIAVLERALALPVQDPPWQARGRFYLAQAHFYLGQAEQAAAAFAHAAEAAERDGLTFWRANALAFLGYLETTRGEAGGFAKLDQAAELQAALGDRYGRSFTYALLGEAHLAAMHLDEAERAFEAQLAVALELGVGEDHVTSLANLATVRWLAGRHQAALEACAAALPPADAQGLPVALLARAIQGLALACTGDLARAAAALAEAGDERGEAGYMFLSALPFLLEGWRWLGRPDEALRLVERVRGRAGVDRAQLLALEGEARLLLEGPAGARTPAREALAAAGDAPLAAILATRLQTRLALAEGRPADALEAGSRALALADAAGAAGYAAEVHGLVGAAGVALDHPGAGARYRAMRLYADQHGVPFLRALALAGEAAAEPRRAGAEALRLEAIQVVQALAEGLEPLARKAFLATPACAALLGDAPAEGARAAAGAHDTAERARRFAEELAAFASEHDALGQAAAAGQRRQALVDAWLAALAPALSSQALCERLLAVALEHTRADRALVLVPGEDEGFAVRAGRHRRSPRAGFSAAVCRRVHMEGVAVSVLDAEGPAGDLGVCSVLCAPLASGGQAAGVLYLDARAALATFTRDDLALVELLGRLAGAALLTALHHEA